MQRYRQIEDILATEKPDSIVEVGTWNGERAIKMYKAANASRYIGFDLFDEATETTDAKEMNVKPHFTQDDVYKKLESAGVDALLIKGNTRKTLPEFIQSFGDGHADFAFIDGGHSVETIRSDYEAVKKIVKKGKYIIFDDYYSHMPEGFDLNKYGANKVVENIPGYRVLPSSDPVKGGGITHLVVVKND